MDRTAYIEMAHLQAAHWWFAARRRILRDQLRALHLAPDAQILEVGCGTGGNLALLAAFGKVTGLEMDREAVAMARSTHCDHCAIDERILIRQGRCPEDLGVLAQRFDLICLFDVLEHIEVDQQALRALAALLKPGGRMMITVPAYQWMWGHHDEHLHHKRRYDAGKLSKACAGANVTVTSMTHFNTLLFPLALFARWTDKLSGSRTSEATDMPAVPINHFLELVFGWERHLLKHLRLPFGLSLLAIAEARA